MKIITTITSNPFQEFSYVMEDGKRTTFTLRFLPTQRRWLLDVSDANGFEVHGLYVCCHPNLLDKWHNILKYGVNIATDDKADPFGVDDFESGYASFSILNNDEKMQATEFLNGLQS